MNSRYLSILFVLCLALCASVGVHAQATSEFSDHNEKVNKDSAIYQGMSVKLDIAMPVLELIRSKGAVQDYEIAMNVRLANRFYPTLELGYAIASTSADGGDYKGQGGFMRVGMDLSALKKGAGDNCLMVGLRLAGAYQGFQVTEVPVHGDVLFPMPHAAYYDQHKLDCWGEIVAGCQVQVWKGFQMGWYVRMKLLMTRTDKQGDALPAYLPGFGYRRDFNWGMNYFLGWKF